jgi:hypothetical protein
MHNFNNHIGIICIIAQRYRRFWHSDDGVYRIALDAARSKTLAEIETIFHEYIKIYHENIWKHVLLHQKYIPLNNIEGRVLVASEVLIDKNIVPNNDIESVRSELLVLAKNLYIVNYDGDIDNGTIDFSLVDEAMEKTIDVYAESVLRKKGDTSTRYNHQLVIGDASVIMQHYLPKPDSLPGNPDRTIVGRVCGVLSDEKEHFVRLVNEDGKKEYFEYIEKDHDKTFTTAICKKWSMKVVVRQLIDDKKRLYWQVLEASKI